jgi:hypothetical protein
MSAIRLAAASRRTRAVVQPALAHMRHGDAGRVMLGGGDVADQRHRLRVTAPRPHLGQPLAIADRLECPPVRQVDSHAANRNRPVLINRQASLACGTSNGSNHIALKEHGAAHATRDARARGTYDAVGVEVIVVT